MTATQTQRRQRVLELLEEGQKLVDGITERMAEIGTLLKETEEQAEWDEDEG